MEIYGEAAGLIALITVAANIMVYMRKVREGTVPLNPKGQASFMVASMVLVVAAFVLGAGYLGIISGTAAFIGAGFFLLINYTSGLPEKLINAEVGEQIPEFRALDSEGKPFSPLSLKGKPFVLIFFRGWWCTFCAAELRLFELRRKKFSELGIEMVTISPDTVEETARFREKHGFHMRMLSDESLEVTDLYNLRHENAIARGGRGMIRPLAIPSTILVDAEGIVRWIYRSVDYRVRSHPDEVIKAARDVLSQN